MERQKRIQAWYVQREPWGGKIYKNQNDGTEYDTTQLDAKSTQPGQARLPIGPDTSFGESNALPIMFQFGERRRGGEGHREDRQDKMGPEDT